MTQAEDAAEGTREAKRRKTLQRIAETGLRLFVEHGYEATTLDAVAKASGISRRTFFSYFKSKEDVLLAHQGSGFAQALRAAMLEQPAGQAPVDAVHACLRELASRYETKESITADQLLRSTEALRLRKEAAMVELEENLAGVLMERWTDPDLRPGLQMDAMVAIGMLRLALRHWREDKAKRPLAVYIDESFALLNSRLTGD